MICLTCGFHGEFAPETMYVVVVVAFAFEWLIWQLLLAMAADPPFVRNRIEMTAVEC